MIFPETIPPVNEPYLATSLADKGSRRSGWMWSMLLLICLSGFFWLGVTAQAAAQTKPPAPVESRFLIIIEASQPMRGRLDGVCTALDALVQDTLPPLMRKGDSLGVWVYNQELFTGEFPLHRWAPESQPALRDRIFNFARTRLYQKTPRLGRVVDSLEGVIKDSPSLTVFLITTGDEALPERLAGGNTHPASTNSSQVAVGDPARIQSLTPSVQWRKEQERARMPFLMVLRYRDGHLFDCSTTPAPFPVTLSALPPHAVPVATVVPPAVHAPTNPPPAPIGKPLILIGRKTPKPEDVQQTPTNLPPKVEPQQAATPTNATLPEPALQTPQPPPAAPAIAKLEKPEPPAAPPNIPKPEPTPTIPAASEPPPIPPPAPTVAQPAPPPPEPVVKIPGAPTNSPPDVSPTTPTPTVVNASTGPTPPPSRRVIGLLTLVIGVGLFATATYLFIGRRRKPHVSLITRSLKHPKKNDHTS